MPFDRTDEAYIRRKQTVATDLTSREMSMLDLQIRERAFWSATVNNAQVVSAMQKACSDLASGKLSMSDARMAIDSALKKSGYVPADGTKGSIRDLNTIRRQNLILQTNVEMARGYARLAEAQEDLDLYPCQELIRIRKSRIPRDWQTRWHTAGGKLYAGRMIAEINSPIWTNLSRFGTPYPPFDFNSGMGVVEIRRDEAVKLGVIKADSVQEPIHLPSINESLEAEIKFATPELKADISKKFGGFAEWQGDKLVFTDPNGTKKYSSEDIVDVLNKELPKNLYGKDKNGEEISPYLQRDVAIKWSRNSDWIKAHPSSDEAYHINRLVERIIPEKVDFAYRGLSWNPFKTKDKKRFEEFQKEIESGYYTQRERESYTSELDVAKDFAGEKIVGYVIIIENPSRIRDISKIVGRYNPKLIYEKEMLFSGERQMKIINREEHNGIIYLRVREE